MSTAAVAALVLSCSGPGAPTAGPPTAPAPTAPPGTPPTTTTSPVADPAGPPPTTCPPPVGAAAGSVTGDVDDDGGPDRIEVVAPEPSGTWVLRVVTARGAATVPLEVTSQTTAVRPLGVTRLGGRPVVAAVVDSGASTEVVGLFLLEGCTLVPVTDETGRPLLVPVGGSVTHGDGFRCDAGRLVVVSVRSGDGLRYTWTETTMTLGDGRLRVDGVATDEIPGDDPRLGNAYDVDCPGLRW